MKSTLFCKLWSVLGLVGLANVWAFVCRLLMLIVSPISFSTFPSLSFLWSVNPKISVCGRDVLNDKVRV